MSSPAQEQVRYEWVRSPAEERANKAGRVEYAKALRTLRKANPKIARLVWRRTKEASAALSRQIWGY